ncbi:LysR family transcriptional regulator [Roseibium denhamense]|uniref:Transcriptional regulator, LysR family n=1 Tax=Roseibium denhamense TaxID=76305 RepID=A0ABY1PHG4_9HYPH|nr:LysR family transcriptional regulator [Roseibium denhamense]MTI06275.1 LysR family transcriptional regulator [Roseibium denhamense]SMP32945.1 transcriptional regulator, LysR family [Roseibium denhamense]
MDVSIEQLKSLMVFAQVVNRGTFSAAGKHLGLSRAVVSYHIKKLETLYGLKLLNRSTRRLSVTEAGQQLYTHCETILREAQAAQHVVERFKHEPEGSLRISCPVSMGLGRMVPIFSAFRKAYPKIKLSIDFTDEVVDILKGGYDIAFRGGRLENSDLQATKLATLHTCLCGSPGYLNTSSRPKTIDDLQQHEWVVYERAREIEFTLENGQSVHFEPSGSIATNNAAARTAFVEAGLGLGRIPAYDALPRIEDGRLEAVLPDIKLLPIAFYGVFPPGASMSKNLRLLLDFSKQSLAQN